MAIETFLLTALVATFPFTKDVGWVDLIADADVDNNVDGDVNSELIYRQTGCILILVQKSQTFLNNM